MAFWGPPPSFWRTNFVFRWELFHVQSYLEYIVVSREYFSLSPTSWEIHCSIFEDENYVLGEVNSVTWAWRKTLEVFNVQFLVFLLRCGKFIGFREKETNVNFLPRTPVSSGAQISLIFLDPQSKIFLTSVSSKMPRLLQKYERMSFSFFSWLRQLLTIFNVPCRFILLILNSWIVQ